MTCSYKGDNLKQTTVTVIDEASVTVIDEASKSRSIRGNRDLLR